MTSHELQQTVNAVRADVEVKAYVQQLLSVVSFEIGESTVSLFLRQRKARRLEAELDTLLRAKYSISLDDIKTLFNEIDAARPEAAITSTD